MTSVTVHHLDVWRDSIELVKSVGAAVRCWPSQTDSIGAEALRISVAIPVSLADGRGRDDPAQARRFAQLAISSAFELDTLLIIAGELGFQDIERISALRRELAFVMRRIENFISVQEWRMR